jgi:hypothetical protein
VFGRRLAADDDQYLEAPQAQLSPRQPARRPPSPPTRPAGTITSDAAALTANTTVTSTLTNGTIEANDVLALDHASGGTAGSYALKVWMGAARSASINVRNITAGSLREAIVIRFVLVKAVSS